MVENRLVRTGVELNTCRRESREQEQGNEAGKKGAGAKRMRQREGGSRQKRGG